MMYLSNCDPLLFFVRPSTDFADEIIVMRIVMQVAIVLLLATPAVAQAQGHQTKDEKTKEEIQKLFSDLNEAITKRDRVRQVYCFCREIICGPLAFRRGTPLISLTSRGNISCSFQQS